MHGALNLMGNGSMLRITHNRDAHLDGIMQICIKRVAHRTHFVFAWKPLAAATVRMTPTTLANTKDTSRLLLIYLYRNV